MLKDGRVYTTAEIRVAFEKAFALANKEVLKTIEESNADKDPMSALVISMTAMIGMAEIKKQLFEEEN